MLLKASFKGLHSFPLFVPRSVLIMAPTESGSFLRANVDVFPLDRIVRNVWYWKTVVACIILLHIIIFNHAKSLNTVYLVLIFLLVRSVQAMHAYILLH